MVERRSRRLLPAAAAVVCAGLTVGLTVAAVDRGRVDATELPRSAHPLVLLMGDSCSEGGAPTRRRPASPTTSPSRSVGAWPGTPATPTTWWSSRAGRTTRSCPRARITEGVDASVREVRERSPSAQLLVMGPVELYGTASEDRSRLNLALVEHTHDHAILYINPVAERWFAVGLWRTLVDQAKGHPDNDGYVRVTRRLVADVQELSRPAAG